MPAAESAVAAIAVTDPLPFVPATITEVKAVWGSPSARQSVRMFSSPSLMPCCSRLDRKAQASPAGGSATATRVRWLSPRGGGGGLRVERGGGRAGIGRCSRRAGGGLCRGGADAEHEAERVGERGFERAAVDDEIDHPVLEEEFAPLEALGER